jgi:chromosome segregation ATPase
MKKAFLLFFILSFWSSSEINAQNTALQKCEMKVKTLTSQRDSLQILYFAVLTRLDSLTGDYIALEKKSKKMDTEIVQLKREINDQLTNKSDTISQLTTAKKLIADQNDLIQKLEAEIKRLSQKQKTD